MRIGNLSEATGTPVETIRFYEREGLIPAAQRSDNNYRMYTAAHAERLAFIRHCRNLDMALDEIRSLLRLRDATPEDCGEVNQLLDEHIGHVASRVRELRARLAEVERLYLERLMKTRDANEGLAAFIERRTPAWEHR